ncbi:MAG: fructosamine kinase family protein [Thiobacillus sp.]
MPEWFAEIAAAIGTATGVPFHPSAPRSLSGGDINAAYLFDDGSQRFFVKLNTASRRDMFAAEADGLAALAATQSVCVPRVIVSGTANTQAFLVLEALELSSHGDAARLGEQLASLHRANTASSHFGWPHDNWIGATPQRNATHIRWIEFWRTQRLVPQLQLAAHNGYGGALQRDGDQLCVRLDGLFDGYTPAPSLLHGDLWGGNHGYLADDTPVLFDPAVYVGDRECDLAMTELFGGYPPDFYAAYRAAWPLDAGYAIRKSLYNLYHILNHANLFGGGYAAQAARMTAQLLAHLR